MFLPFLIFFFLHFLLRDTNRLQNMILAVGPGTPAYELYHHDSDSSHEGSYSDESFDDSYEDDSDDDDNYNNSDDNDGTNMTESNHMSTTFGRKRRASSHECENEINEQINDEQCADDHVQFHNQTAFKILEEYVPSMKHNGCVNTSTWLSTGWRVSRARTDDSFLNSFIVSDSYSSNSKIGSIHSIEAEECPTQLMTSGDDARVKIWDVEMSMGRASPNPSSCTECPFGYIDMEDKIRSSIAKPWKSRYRYTDKVPGLVKLMATVQTSHRGNVFHAIPAGVDRKGKILTCAADGTLRMSDVDHQSSSENSNTSSQIILGPTNEEHFEMCFSIHMLDQNNGLLCSEPGLKRFDLRVGTRSQSYAPLLEIDGSKGCAVYSTSSEDSSYVFADGGNYICLYDLRFIPGKDQNVVQRYMPDCLYDQAIVSGLDLSKDRKELLVSYENDYIYTFPVFRSAQVSPTIDEILSFEAQHESDKNLFNRQFASYGGHLNRFTFLKAAKYAGPNDEYICTGSDSGHAFIYDKISSAVVSLLKADTSICNGIVPHPTLPLFVTYGMNSSAKLWRASIPVDDDVDDSIVGRRLKYEQKKYVASPVALNWREVQERLSDLMECDNHCDIEMFPDEIVLDPISPPGILDDISDMFFSSFLDPHPFKYVNHAIVNDLMNLPKILANNLFESLTFITNDERSPTVGEVEEIRRRMSILRLHHQAQELGLYLDPSEDEPWKLTEIQSNRRLNKSLSMADTIPNFPSDWLQFDKRFSVWCITGGCNFNKHTYREFFELLYNFKQYHGKEGAEQQTSDIDNDGDDDDDDYDKDAFLELLFNDDDDDDDDDDAFSKAFDLLHDTIKQLKEEGNKACKDGKTHLAATYYDKALRYCSIAFTDHEVGRFEFLSDHKHVLLQNDGYNIDWSPFFKNFISIQLNLSMVNLKPEIYDLEAAAEQLRLVLHYLTPFVEKSGIILTGEGLRKIERNQPVEIYKEAKEFQSKAYFRLGTVMMEMKKFSYAEMYYGKCLECRKAIHPNSPPDKLILKKLALAKNQAEKKQRRERKKFKFSFGGAHGDSD
jgi:hypothetical protein